MVALVDGTPTRNIAPLHPTLPFIDTMTANVLDLEILASPELIAVTSSQILVGLGSLYLGLVVCWAVYWMFFGMSEKKRHASMALLTHQVKTQQKQLANIEREFSLTIDAFAISHAKAQTLELELTMMQERVEQLESAQFELEQQAEDWATQSEITKPEADLSIATDTIGTTPAMGESVESILPSISLFNAVPAVSRKTDDSLGLVSTEAPAHPDDLTLIWGIGAVNQQRLYDHGVYFFKQISQWTPEQIDAFNVILGFKGRIEREQWVSQAERFSLDAITATQAA